VILWREKEIAQDDVQAGRSLGTKISTQVQGPNFDLVGTSQNVVVRETRGAAHTMCCHVLPMQDDTNSNCHDTLGYEWPLARCYHLVVCIDG
jgi:hypothetical protein